MRMRHSSLLVATLIAIGLAGCSGSASEDADSSDQASTTVDPRDKRDKDNAVRPVEDLAGAQLHWRKFNEVEIPANEDLVDPRKNHPVPSVVVVEKEDFRYPTDKTSWEKVKYLCKLTPYKGSPYKRTVALGAYTIQSATSHKTDPFVVVVKLLDPSIGGATPVSSDFSIECSGKSKLSGAPVLLGYYTLKELLWGLGDIVTSTEE